MKPENMPAVPFSAVSVTAHVCMVRHTWLFALITHSARVASLKFFAPLAEFIFTLHSDGEKKNTNVSTPTSFYTPEEKKT